jgi:hypothetical protein
MIDIREEQLDMNLVDIGLAYNHGEDKEGNSIVILNCSLHKKDPKKLPDLERFFIFALESHSRCFPDKKVTLIFNMAHCGLSNMDLEFVKVIINCFKFYFPNMLGYLLVFEMPWLLQAAWRIIKSWLSEAAVRKIKFVTKSDITDYISASQLLTQFGGEDDWTYDPEEYKREMRDQVESIWAKDPLGIPPQDNSRQVRFAPGQSPTHQSRYGTDEDNSYYTRRHTIEPQLLRGTAASPGYRRRQVNKLITTQKSHSISLGNSYSVDTDSLNSTNFLPSFIMISPLDELVFTGEPNEELSGTIELTNIGDVVIAYKIKTTAPKNYKVRPNFNTINPDSKATIVVQLTSRSIESIAQDKFLIQVYEFKGEATPPDSASMTEFWKQLHPRDIYEYKLKCRYIEPPIKPPVNEVTPNHVEPSRMDKMISKKLDNLSDEIRTLQGSVSLLKYYLIITLTLLVLLLLILILL